jgi:hypothetical protein
MLQGESWWLIIATPPDAADDDITVDATGASRIRIDRKAMPVADRRRYGPAASVPEIRLPPSKANIWTRKSTAELLDEAAQGAENAICRAAVSPS